MTKRHGAGGSQPAQRFQPPSFDGVTWAHQIKPEKLQHLWPGFFVHAAVNIIEGRKSTGKSSVVAAIAAAVTGGPRPPGFLTCAPRQVLWDAREESWSKVVRPRLSAAGADVKRCARLMIKGASGRERKLRIPSDLDQLEDFIHRADVGLIFLDPYITSADTGNKMIHDQEIREYMEPFGEMLERTNCCAILSRHLTKDRNAHALDAGLGGTAVGNYARSVVRCEEFPSSADVLLMRTIATNYGGLKHGLTFRVPKLTKGWPRVEWIGECHLSAEELAEEAGSASEQDEWKDAELLLYALLSDGFERTRAVQAEADDAGISWSSMKRAKTRLKVTKKRTSGGGTGYWEWGPPAKEWPRGLAEAHKTLTNPLPPKG